MPRIAVSACASSYIRQIEWFQITPLLVKAEKVLVSKSKIDAKGQVTNDINKWALKAVNWVFSPFEDPISTMTIATLNEKGEPDDKLTETFDFLSGAFKFYYDTLKDEIFGEITKNESGYDVVYRYRISFYGSQKINSNDLLVKNDECFSSSNSKINNVIAL